MRQILVVFCLFTCLLVPNSVAGSSNQENWEVDLENGYISTKPIFVGDQVIVRTSGFWTGEDRPHVYSFDVQSGIENWRFSNPNSTNHDMSPLLHISAGQGECGTWSDMILVAWTDGRVTALNPDDGGLIWSSKTEVVTWGITGAMAQDGDNIVVPTRQGLSRFCLSDGTENLRVDLPQLGWRNGVTVTDDSYLLGNEEGVLNIISKDGIVANITLSQGMIRHPPIVTAAGIVSHLQTSSGSAIYLDAELISEEGSSPAIPVKIGNKVYFGTSESVSVWVCETDCVLDGRSDFHTNGEITIEPNGNDSVLWYPRNTQQGGWGYGIPGEEIELFSSSHDTYTTAGMSFGPNGEMAFGSDAGVLVVILSDEDLESIQKDESRSSSFQAHPAHFLMVGLLLGIAYSTYNSNRDMTNKLGVLLILVVAIFALPTVSEMWSKEVDKLTVGPGDWNDDWPDSWKETQVVVFELPDGEVAIGGLTGYENVEQLTDAAALELGLTIEKESYSLGEMVVSIDGHELEGWEFTLDGERTPVGISQAEVGEDSVVRWSAA
ncbi:MAG: PQQ-binding-like beta-propeller repeat protein [Candidatus Thermoplasmatota archaeon]|nr:PQQ-binding-like beta-propeller repeat protein [Candidatus Thermoplasmatota archaeon]|tara:strand:- start:948 stop:2594 length:1647 start_codon:yes stop_codon:yes gene_type:complete